MKSFLILVLSCILGYYARAEKWESHFKLATDRLQQQPINSSFETMLTNRGFDVASLRQKEFPVGLRVVWQDYHSDCNIQVVPKKGISFATSTKLNFRGGGEWNTVNNYRLKIACQVSGTGSLTMGFLGHGVYGYKLQTKQYTFSNAENEVAEYHLPVFNQCAFTRIALGFEGDLMLSRLECYRQPLDGVSVVEGTIEEISTTPNPAKAAYPDCYITAKYRVNQILKGESVKRDVQLLLPAFWNRKLTPYAKIKPSEKWSFSLVPFERLPENLKSINQADNLQLFELDSYYVENAIPVKKFQNISSGINFSEYSEIDYVSIFKRSLNPMPLPEIEKKRVSQMEEDLKMINRYIAFIEEKREELNVSFSKHWIDKQKGYNRLNEKLIWGKVSNSFWALPVNYLLLPPEEKITEQNLAALKSHQEMYHANGIHFIIQIIPYFYDISARVLNPEFRDVPDYRSAIVAKQLLDAGIEAMYMSQAMVADFNRHPLMFLYPEDDHPADGCQDILTDALIPRLRRFPVMDLASLRPECFSITKKPIGKDLRTWPKSCDVDASVRLYHDIRYNDKGIQSDDTAPLLIIGNSFIRTPSDNSYPAYLASKSLLIPHVFRVSGWGPLATIPASIFMNPEPHLKGKRMIVLPIGVRWLSSKQPFVNIRQLDENRLQLNGKVDIGQLELNESLYDFPLHKSNYSLMWKSALANSKSYKLTQPGCFLLGEYSLPKPWNPDKDGVLTITAMVSYDRNIDLKVNGKSLPVVVPCIGKPQWTTLVFPLQSQTKTVKIEVKTEKPDTLFGIKSIKFFQ